MTVSGTRWLRLESVTLIVLVIVLCVSVGIVGGRVALRNDRLKAREWMSAKVEHPVQAMKRDALKAVMNIAEAPAQAASGGESLLTGELRVAAIGSAYPIPYDAEVCPFSNIPQPSMNQMDRDGDGITDDWELRYGLDKYNAADALADLDADGFVNLEEFDAGTDPAKPDSHPPYALKLRFLERKFVPFPLVFKGVSSLPDGRKVFQINTPGNGKTHFPVLGDDVEGILLQRFVPGESGSPARLVVVRGGTEIMLPRGEIIPDPESKAELINILDRSREIATMGALLSLHNDEYTVLGVYADKVVLKHRGTGLVFDIVGLADEERRMLFGGFE